LFPTKHKEVKGPFRAKGIVALKRAGNVDVPITVQVNASEIIHVDIMKWA
jgi:hypothetical protein